MLKRRVGRLADLAKGDLEKLMRAYAMGDVSAVELSVGRTGSINIRFHSEWDQFAKQLVRLAQDFAFPLVKSRSILPAEEPCMGTGEDEYPELAVACSESTDPDPQTPVSWHYQTSRPFICSSAHDSANGLQWLGDAVTAYFSQEASSAPRGCSHKFLDRESYVRLRPFLGIRLDPLLAAPNPVALRTRLLENIDEDQQSDLQALDIRTIVESVRLVKTQISKARTIFPTHLAARRSQID